MAVAHLAFEDQAAQGVFDFLLDRALDRAGAVCRVIADALGSRAMIRSQQWQSMRNAGVDLAVALPISNPLLRPFAGRVDLRNHRKIVVVDGTITYCGSQNCADPEFLVKSKYAPWVDAMIRFEGPVARQNLYLFASDWMTFTAEDIREVLLEPIPAGQRPGFTAQVIGTGPTARESAMPEMFESLIYAARRELIVTTPYYVPNESLQNALCSAAYRGHPSSNGQKRAHPYFREPSVAARRDARCANEPRHRSRAR